MGAQYPEGRSRSTRDRSPVRESRTPGSARGAGSNPRPYRDHCFSEAAKRNDDGETLPAFVM
jgi:hypothetical protein